MSRKRILLISIFIIIFFIGSYFKGVSNMVSSIENSKGIEVEPILETYGKIRICVDPRIELMASIELNSNFHKIDKEYSGYKQNVRKHFEPLKNHIAVEMFKEMDSKGIIYMDAPPTFMLSLSNVPNLRVISPIEQYVIENFTKDKKTTDEFIYALQDYAKNSNIEQFFHDNTDFYKNIILEAKKVLEGTNYVDDIEEYYGMKQKSYTVILSPLYVGNFGPRIKSDDGYDLYAIITGNFLKYGFDEKMIRYLIWHEFSHSFINPLSDLYSDEINKYADNYDAIAGNMERQGYNTTLINSINEYIIKAITVRLTYLNYGEEQAKAVLDEEIGTGFVYMYDLVEKLEIYENNREKYKTIEEFYPELIKVFEKRY